MRWIAALCAMLLALPASAQMPAPGTIQQFAAAGHRPLSGERIQAMALGNTNYAMLLEDWQGGVRGNVSINYFRAPGRSTLLLADGKTRVDATWWIEGGDRICAKYRLMTDVLECRQWFDVGDVIYVCRVPTGECRWAVRIVPGNPEKL